MDRRPSGGRRGPRVPDVCKTSPDGVSHGVTGALELVSVAGPASPILGTVTPCDSAPWVRSVRVRAGFPVPGTVTPCDNPRLPSPAQWLGRSLRRPGRRTQGTGASKTPPQPPFLTSSLNLLIRGSRRGSRSPGTVTSCDNPRLAASFGLDCRRAGSRGMPEGPSSSSVEPGTTSRFPSATTPGRSLHPRRRAIDSRVSPGPTGDGGWTVPPPLESRSPLMTSHTGSGPSPWGCSRVPTLPARAGITVVDRPDTRVSANHHYASNRTPLLASPFSSCP